MTARYRLGTGLFATALAALFATEAAAHRPSPRVHRAGGPTRLGPWVEQGWAREDWGRAPAVRGWAYSAPWDYDPVTGYPASDAQYPWGYTTPFVRVGRNCVASEFNYSPGGDVARYQRVRPASYCR